MRHTLVWLMRVPQNSNLPGAAGKQHNFMNASDWESVGRHLQLHNSVIEKAAAATASPDALCISSCWPPTTSGVHKDRQQWTCASGWLLLVARWPFYCAILGLFSRTRQRRALPTDGSWTFACFPCNQVVTVCYVVKPRVAFRCYAVEKQTVPVVKELLHDTLLDARTILGQWTGGDVRGNLGRRNWLTLMRF